MEAFAENQKFIIKLNCARFECEYKNLKNSTGFIKSALDAFLEARKQDLKPVGLAGVFGGEHIEIELIEFSEIL